MKKVFTLIELIVVIVVISILAAIVIPNISSWQKEANITAVASNLSSLQNSVDLYSLKNNGTYPVYEKQPTLNVPQPVNFEKLTPEYLRTTPKTYGAKYWVDSYGKVWASTVDAPEGVKNEGGILSWEKVENAKEYKIFKDEGFSGVVSSVTESSDLTYVATTEDLTYNVEVGGNYVVSAVDMEGMESVPVGAGYEGYISLGDFLNKESSELAPEFLELKNALNSLESYVGDYEMKASLSMNVMGSEVITSDQSEGSINGANMKVTGVSTSNMFGTPSSTNYETIVIGETIYQKSPSLSEDWIVLPASTVSDLGLEGVDTVETTVSDITSAFSEVQITHLPDTSFHGENVHHFQMNFSEETFRKYLSSESILSEEDLGNFSVEYYTVDFYIKDSQLVGMVVSNKINSDLYETSVQIISTTEQYFKNRGVATTIVAPL